MLQKATESHRCKVNYHNLSQCIYIYIVHVHDYMCMHIILLLWNFWCLKQHIHDHCLRDSIWLVCKGYKTHTQIPSCVQVSGLPGCVRWSHLTKVLGNDDILCRIIFKSSLQEKVYSSYSFTVIDLLHRSNHNCDIITVNPVIKIAWKPNSQVPLYKQLLKTLLRS